MLLLSSSLLSDLLSSFILCSVSSSSLVSVSSLLFHLVSSLLVSPLSSSLVSSRLSSFIFSFLLFYCLVLSFLVSSCHSFSVSLGLSLFLSSFSVSLFLCLRVLLCVCGVVWSVWCCVCCVVVCGACMCSVEKTSVCRFKTCPCGVSHGTPKKPPCVDSKRHAHMLKHMCAWCRHTRGRFERTHGHFLNPHTGSRGSSPVLPTKICPRTVITCFRGSPKKLFDLSHFQFESRSRTTRARFL